MSRNKTNSSYSAMRLWFKLFSCLTWKVKNFKVKIPNWHLKILAASSSKLFLLWVSITSVSFGFLPVSQTLLLFLNFLSSPCNICVPSNRPFIPWILYNRNLRFPQNVHWLQFHAFVKCFQICSFSRKCLNWKMKVCIFNYPIDISSWQLPENLPQVSAPSCVELPFILVHCVMQHYLSHSSRRKYRCVLDTIIRAP